jgi:hypothetical protein
MIPIQKTLFFDLYLTSSPINDSLQWIHKWHPIQPPEEGHGFQNQ